MNQTILNHPQTGRTTPKQAKDLLFSIISKLPRIQKRCIWRHNKYGTRYYGTCKFCRIDEKIEAGVKNYVCYRWDGTFEILDHVPTYRESYVGNNWRKKENGNQR